MVKERDILAPRHVKRLLRCCRDTTVLLCENATRYSRILSGGLFQHRRDMRRCRTIIDDDRAPSSRSFAEELTAAPP